MIPNLRRYLNKTILVSISTLSEGGTCRPYKLAGIELVGLWLEGNDLSNGFLDREYKSGTAVTWQFFIPFSHIACVAVGTTSAAAPAKPAQSTAQGQAPDEPPPPTADASSSATGVTRKKPKAKG